MARRHQFDHERLDAYQVVLIDQVVEHLPRGRAYLANQLQRAGTSVPLNIAEGAGEYSGSEKGRFYRMAERSATECAGIFEICRRLELIEESQYLRARDKDVSDLKLRVGYASGLGREKSILQDTCVYRRKLKNLFLRMLP